MTYGRSLIAGCAHCDASIADRWQDNYIDEHGTSKLLCGDCWDNADGLVCDLCDTLCNDTQQFEQGGECHTLCDRCEKETRPVEVQS